MKSIPIATAVVAVLLAAVPAAAQTLLVGNKGENSLSFVDLVTGREVRRVATGPMPHEIAISPDGRQAAVVSYGGREIQLFDVAEAKLIRAIDLGEGARPHGLIWLADGRIVATGEGVDALFVAAPDGKVLKIPTGQKGSHMVAVDAARGTAYVANMRSASVTAIDLRTGRKLADIAVGKEPEGLALSRDGSTLWVADRGGDALHVFDTGTRRELARSATGKTPIRVAISPDGRFAVTSNFGDGSLGVYDVATRALVRTIAVGQPGHDQVTLLFADDGRRLYVAETGIDRIAEVDFASGRVIGRLPAGKNGDGLAITPVMVKAPD